MIVLYNPKVTRPRNRRLPLSVLAIAAVLEGKEEYTIVDGNLDPNPTSTIAKLMEERSVEARGGALVWGPSSNVFTLGRTLDRSTLLRHRRVALGGDSALTAEGDLLDEVRFACECAGFSSEEAFQAGTSGAANALRLTDGEGSLEPGAVADAIAIPDAGEPPATTLCKSSFRDVECVIVGEQPRLLSPRLARRWAPGFKGKFSRLRIEGVERLLDGPVSRLLEQTKQHLPAGFRLAGKRVEI
jgi:hypothetical protein